MQASVQPFYFQLAVWTLSLAVGFLYQFLENEPLPQHFPCLILSCFALFDYHLLGACSFLKRKQSREWSQGRSDMGREIWEERKEGKNVASMYCMKDNLFSGLNINLLEIVRACSHKNVIKYIKLN